MSEKYPIGTEIIVKEKIELGNTKIGQFGVLFSEHFSETLAEIVEYKDNGLILIKDNWANFKEVSEDKIFLTEESEKLLNREKNINDLNID
jgi:hypothetical protein